VIQRVATNLLGSVQEVVRIQQNGGEITALLNVWVTAIQKVATNLLGGVQEVVKIQQNGGEITVL
jgi:hypothetical protein